MTSVFKARHMCDEQQMEKLKQNMKTLHLALLTPDGGRWYMQDVRNQQHTVTAQKSTRKRENLINNHRDAKTT